MSNHLFQCPCGNELIVASEDSGARISCPRCQCEVTVPQLALVNLLPEAPAAVPTKEKKSTTSLGPYLIVLGLIKIVAAFLLPWSYRVFLNEPVPAQHRGVGYLGASMLAMGIWISWSERNR